MPCDLFDALCSEVVDFHRWREGEDATPEGKVLSEMSKMLRPKR